MDVGDVEDVDVLPDEPPCTQTSSAFTAKKALPAAKQPARQRERALQPARQLLSCVAVKRLIPSACREASVASSYLLR